MRYDIWPTKEVGGVIIIPEDFTNSVAIGENRPVTVVGNGVMPLQAYIVKNTAQSAANLVTAAQGAINTIWHYDNEAGLSDSELDARFNEAVMDYMLTALARTAVFESVEAENGSSVTPAEYFTAALIVVFMMFAGMPGMKMLVSERAGGITARLAATPVRMWKVVLSKLLVSIMLLVIQFGIIILMTSRLFNNYWGRRSGMCLYCLGLSSLQSVPGPCLLPRSRRPRLRPTSSGTSGYC